MLLSHFIQGLGEVRIRQPRMCLSSNSALFLQTHSSPSPPTSMATAVSLSLMLKDIWLFHAPFLCSDPPSNPPSNNVGFTFKTVTLLYCPCKSLSFLTSVRNSFLFDFLKSLLRLNSHPIQFSHLKCKIQCFLYITLLMYTWHKNYYIIFWAVVKCVLCKIFHFNHY